MPAVKPGGSANEFQYNNGAGGFSGSPELVHEGPDVLAISDTAALRFGPDGSGVFPVTGPLVLWADIGGADRDAVNLSGFGDAFSIVFSEAGGTLAAPAPVAPDEALGLIMAAGYDGALCNTASMIRMEVDLPLGQHIVPGRIRFLTMGADNVLTERLRIDSTGLVTITGTVNATVAYQANGTPGMTGTFTADGRTVTVTNGLITAITP